MNKLRRKKKEETKQLGTTKHHIIPSSIGGNNHKQNICRVNSKKHEAYHYIFWNLSPDEIIIELVKNYWNGQTQWLDIAISKLKEEENG